MANILRIPATTRRVPRETDAELNERIRRQTESSISHYGGRGTVAIDARLVELDHEWDIERTLEANAAVVSLIGFSLGALLDRRLFVLPAIVATFLLQHAVQGWCPPVPLFRRFGVRTQTEIEYERYALKAFRGDFRELQSPVSAGDAGLILDIMQQ